MSWDWERLSDVVRRLKMPAGEYAVDRIGYGLSRDPASTADQVWLLVTENGWRRLKERGWRERGGGSVLRHPQERNLNARVVALDGVRADIQEVDGVPVVAVEPDPVDPRSETSRQLFSGGLTGVVLAAVIGAVAYGFTLFYPATEPGVIRQHLAFQTTKVHASVVSSAETGRCAGARVYDSSPRVDLTLTWTRDGEEQTGSYTGCGASTDDPQDVWVTDDGDVASQQSPWFDHFWPALAVGLVPLAFIAMPLFDRLRARWWSRRRA